MLQPEEVNVVIYHKNCFDGFGSAYCAWKYDKKGKIEYYPATHGDLPPNVKNKNVLICDFSYKKDILNVLIKECNKLYILDHHKSAEKELKEFDDMYKLFDMTHSGAYLTWKYFFPKIKTPLLIKYIEDRDLWTKKLPLIDEFTFWFSTIPYEFEEYDKLLDEKYLVNNIKTKGIIIAEFNNNIINKLSKNTLVKLTKIDKEYYMIAYSNVTGTFKSDVGNVIIKKYENADFSACYSIVDHDNSTLFSLRSTENNLDVSKIASKFGGGGHRNASGLKINYVTNTLTNNVINYNFYDKLNNIYFDTYSNKNIVYFNSSIYQYEIFKYLLRKRTDKQVCLCITNNEEIDEVQLACIWNYDGINDETVFTIIDQKNKVIEKTYSGLHKKLTNPL